MKKKSDKFCFYCHGTASSIQTKFHEWTVSGTLWKYEFEIPVCGLCELEMRLSWADIPERAEKVNCK